MKFNNISIIVLESLQSKSLLSIYLTTSNGKLPKLPDNTKKINPPGRPDNDDRHAGRPKIFSTNNLVIVQAERLFGRPHALHHLKDATITAALCQLHLINDSPLWFPCNGLLIMSKNQGQR